MVQAEGSSGHDQVVLLDADSDGDLDIAAAVAADQASWRILSNDRGDFSVQSLHPSAGRPRAHLGAADDFDGDGAADLVSGFSHRDRDETGTTSGVSLSTNLGDGSGQFGLPADLRVFEEIRSLAVGDLEGDGDLDLLASDGGHSVSLFRNEGRATFPREPALEIGSTTDAVALMDVDGDGDLDLIAHHPTIGLSLAMNP